MSTFGLALGGGGARGLAHIGVLKVLEKENIKVDVITGCSMGALIGGMYAYLGSAKEVEEFIYETVIHPKFLELGINKLNESKKPDKNYFEQFFDYLDKRYQVLKSLNHLSYFDEEATNEIYNLIPDVKIESLKIKFSAIATDLISGEEINFTSGSLREAIKASSAISGIFQPVKYQNYFLIDGSASESLPAGKVRELGTDRVLAIDVMRPIKAVKQPENVVDILYRAEDITSHHLSILRLREADLIIRPKVKHLSWADFEKINEIIYTGEKTTEENIVAIKKLVETYSLLLKLKNMFKKLD